MDFRGRASKLLPLQGALLWAAIVGSLGGFVFGYDLGALSAASDSLRSYFRLAPGPFGLTISASIWGTVLGSIVAGRLADGYERRDGIAACAVLYAAAAMGILSPLSANWLFVLALRFVSGLAIGGFTVACPLHLAEIAPIEQRGRVVGLFQLQVGAGVIVAFAVGAVVAPSAAGWRWMLGAGALPSALLVLLAKRTPRGRPLERIPARQPKVTRQSLFRRQNTRPILVATSIAFFNQLSGVNILLLYMLEILSSAGIGLALGHRFTVLISLLGLGITAAGMAFVDRLGRKPLLYAGSAGMALCLLVLALAIPRRLNPALYAVLLVAYNGFFAFSQGTVVWTYLSELFPPGIRGVGQGYGASAHWIFNALLIAIFPRVQHATSVKIFYFFALMMVIQIVVVRLWYPELRGTALGSASSSGDDRTIRLA